MKNLINPRRYLEFFCHLFFLFYHNLYLNDLIRFLMTLLILLNAFSLLIAASASQPAIIALLFFHFVE